MFERITYHETAREAIEGSQAVFISTDWEEFRGLSGTIERTAKPPYLIIDGRRMIPDHDTLVRRGYDYLSVGGMLLKAETDRGKNDNEKREERREKSTEEGKA